ncbi:uncharacterized protein LOC135684945 isoform X3 [Rhopilema esculentum]|uniref:uncharacterized protein LOC135684945 isoform X2 n=1 Tax=Rhopilema esculentum TaxID=499914 RepID=UPI0031DEC48E
MAQPPSYPYGQKYPQQGYAPPPAPVGATHHTTVYVNQQAPIVVPFQQKSTSQRAAGLIGGVLGSAIRSGSELVTDIAKETSRELDRYATSPLLDCFKPGCGIQIKSKCSGGCLRVLPTGHVDCFGSQGNDYSAHFTIVTQHENKVVLRNVANPGYHLAIGNGMLVATGVGDAASQFRIHETLNHYITFQHSLTGHLIGVDSSGQIAPPVYLNPSKDECKFEIHLMYSPFGHKYIPKH